MKVFSEDVWQGVDMKIIVFGLGKFYLNRREILKQYQTVEIVAFSDNNEALWGKSFEDVRVIAPDSIKDIACDGILIMSTYAAAISEQLITDGIGKERIFFWEPFYSKQCSGEMKVLSKFNDTLFGTRSILIISTDLGYNGGSIAAVYAAQAIQSKGNSVVLAAPDGDEALIEEIIQQGITVAIRPSLPYIFDREREWVSQFDAVFVNVFQMLQGACGASLIRPTLWWIHEAIAIMEDVIGKPWNQIEETQLKNIMIRAVAKIPKDNFNKLFKNHIGEIIPYGIPDMCSSFSKEKPASQKIVFAVIGMVCERKAQEIFCQAVKELNRSEQAEFWIIGKCGDDLYSKKVVEMSRQIGGMKILGLLTREEIYQTFPQIDVVVCTSLEDPLPIVMTEGMMFGKTCITTDRTGTADYIHDGENGFVVPAGDSKALKEKMEWTIQNLDKLETIGRKARETYEKYFTMDVFAENLERAITEAIECWEGV